MAGRGAELIFVPSNFTVPTGAAHWEVLLRARAIETQCYVAAPAQWGTAQPPLHLIRSFADGGPLGPGGRVHARGQRTDPRPVRSRAAAQGPARAADGPRLETSRDLKIAGTPGGNRRRFAARPGMNRGRLGRRAYANNVRPASVPHANLHELPPLPEPLPRRILVSLSSSSPGGPCGSSAEGGCNAGFLGESHGFESRPGAPDRTEGNRFQAQPAQGPGSSRRRSPTIAAGSVSMARTPIGSASRPGSAPAARSCSIPIPPAPVGPWTTRSRWLGRRSKARCGGKDNLKPYDPDRYEGLLRRVVEHVNARGAPLYVQDVFAGTDPAYSVPYRFVGEYAVHAMFAPQHVSEACRWNRERGGQALDDAQRAVLPLRARARPAATPTAPRSSTSATGSASSPGGPTTAGW